jgi:hypothetical protein
MNERLSKIIKNESSVSIHTVIVVGVVSFGAGLGLSSALGYLKMRHERKLMENQQELLPTVFSSETVDAFVDEDRATEENLGEQFVKTKMEEVIEPKLEPELTEEETVVSRSIFAGSDEEWNLDEEIKNRSSDQPYVLHKDEFYADELAYDQLTLTYYAGDDIMIDQEEAPVYNYGTIVGELKFGHGSGDANVFYVRNDKRKAEYEIIRDSGQYSVDVLGLSIEDNQRVQAKGLKHSDDKVRKFSVE